MQGLWEPTYPLASFESPLRFDRSPNAECNFKAAIFMTSKLQLVSREHHQKATGGQTTRVSRLRLIAFSAPAVPLAMLFVPLITYLPAFYSAEVGLSFSSVGAIFMLARMGDALIDPLVGTLSDATRNRFGRRRVWLVGGFAPLMLATYYLCNPRGNKSAEYLLLWLVIFYVAWSVVQVPYLSWGTELDSNYHGRSRVFAFRETGTFVGIMLGTGLPVLLAPPRASLGIVLGIIATAAIVVLPLAVGSAILFVREEGSSNSTQPVAWNGLFRAVRRNRAYARFLSYTLLNYTFLNMANATIVMIVSTNLRLPEAFLPLVFIQYVVGLVVFIPFALWLAKRIDRHRVLALGNLTGAVSLAAMAVIPPGSYWCAAAVFSALGFLNATVWVLPPAIVGDLADYGQFKKEGKNQGNYMAGYNLAVKGGMGLGVGIALPLLQLMGFHANGSLASTERSWVLSFVGCLLPAALVSLITLLIWKFPIDSRRHAILQRWLERRGVRDSSTPDSRESVGGSTLAAAPD